MCVRNLDKGDHVYLIIDGEITSINEQTTGIERINGLGPDGAG